MRLTGDKLTVWDDLGCYEYSRVLILLSMSNVLQSSDLRGQSDLEDVKQRP
jgi:hypothetical protein